MRLVIDKQPRAAVRIENLTLADLQFLTRLGVSQVGDSLFMQLRQRGDGFELAAFDAAPSVVSEPVESKPEPASAAAPNATLNTEEF